MKTLIAVSLILCIFACTDNEEIMPKIEQPTKQLNVADTAITVTPSTSNVYKYEIPAKYAAWVDQFYIDALAYGYNELPKNNLIMIAEERAMTGALSYSKIDVDGQWYSIINAFLTDETAFTAVYRELAMVMLAKKYTREENHPMNPNLNPAFNLSDAVAVKEYKDILFKK